MSGHSKWAQIKRSKGAADVKKGSVFTKLANAVTVAAREGGGDPAMNFKLRLAVERARAANMPKDKIERAVKRGTGEFGGTVLETITYEAFGPGQTALVIEALTDNRNRTAQTIKVALQKHGGTLGGPGSVVWMFDRRGVVRVPRPATYDDAEAIALIDLGVEDIIEDGDELILLTAPEEVASAKERLASNGKTAVDGDVELWPKTPSVFPEGQTGDQLTRLLEALDDNEDVQRVATSAVL